MPPEYDVAAMTDMLVGLLETPSPTGYHREAIAYCQNAFASLGIPDLKQTITGKGALMLYWPGESSEAAVGLTAHLDTLGFMVKEIKSNGNLKLTNLGGINWSGAEFENCTVRTHDDKRYRGTVLLANPSTHVNRDAHKANRDGDSMEIRLDAKTNNRKETEALGIGVGDFVFLDPRVEVIDTGFIRSRFLDDKASVACIWGALKAMQAEGNRPAYDTYILIANYEEVGHGGAAGWPAPLNELVAIDMAAIGDGQASDEFSVSICVKDAGGPYHFDMNNKLRRLADTNSIPYKVDIYVYYSSDGTAFWRAGGDAKVGLIGPGVASSHGYERTHQDALLHSADLIARYLLDSELA
ncbi:MAG: M42 family metallopeptidase [Anaerolineae bacterium]|nr:M42 family metallopeptidase [Anaerolineae bacterium]